MKAKVNRQFITSGEAVRLVRASRRTLANWVESGRVHRYSRDGDKFVKLSSVAPLAVGSLSKGGGFFYKVSELMNAQTKRVTSGRGRLRL